MNKHLRSLVVILLLNASSYGQALLNGDFEQHFGERVTRSEWGDFGETWGNCRQIFTENSPAAVPPRSGIGLVQLDVLPGEWCGVWQQIPAAPETAFFAQGYVYLTADLPRGVQTLLKVEYYDGLDQPLGECTSTPAPIDQTGTWIPVETRGTTPTKTASIRIVVIAGSDLSVCKNTIFWDDVTVSFVQHND